LALLNENLDRPLTLVCAPVGFGKSTLIAQWLGQLSPDNQNVSWFSLDEADNDARRFLIHFVGAIQKVSPNTCHEISGLLCAQALAPIDYLADVLIRDVSLLPPERLYLVLDDCDVIHDPAVLSLLKALVRHLPRQVHLVLLSRLDLPLPLARLRLENRLTEIRSRDLRFTRREIRAYMWREAAVELSEAQVEVLEQNTEGWIALLKLAALLYRSGADLESFPYGFEGDREYLSDYLMEEVVGRQSPPIQDFLLKTSILDRFSVPLCDFVTEPPNADPPPAPPQVGNPSRSAAIMRYLDDANMFLVALDEDKTWYRYHHLFQTLLQRQLAVDSGPENVADLQRRASAWFKSQAMWEEAFDYSLAAGDVASAADLVEENAQTLLDREDPQTLENWLERLPERVIQQRPGLLLARACLLQVRARTDAMPPVLDRAERLLDEPAVESTPDPSKIGNALSATEIRAGIHTLRAPWNNLEGNYQTALSLAEQALSALPERRVWLRMTATAAGSLARHMLGQGPDAVRDIHAALMRDEGPNETPRLRLWIALCFLHFINGHMGHLAESAAILLRNASELGRNISVGWARYLLGLALYEQNDPAGALEHFQAGGALRYRAAHPPVRDSLLGQALAHTALGQEAEAQRTIEDVYGFAEETSSILILDRARSFQVRLCLMRGDTAYAAKLAQESIIHFRSHSLNEIEPPIHTLAWLRLAQGTPEALEEAASLLRQLRQRAVESYNSRWLIGALALHSLVQRARGEGQPALDTLEEALALGQPRGWVRSFVDLGPKMAELLRELADRGVQGAYVAALLRAFESVPSQPTYTAGDAVADANAVGNIALQRGEPPTSSLFEPLTLREEQVLLLLARGLSYEEIALELFITSNTVKKHASNIYSKLGVRRRSQAVIMARRLDLLPSN
jgi:LuxR family maltose regulon positive regulatory protein